MHRPSPFKLEVFYSSNADNLIPSRPFKKIIVGFIVESSFGRERSEFVLIQKRSDNFQWGLPGGHFEPSEDRSLFAGAQREVWEEAGLRLSSHDFARKGVWKHKPREDMLIVDFLMRFPQNRPLRWINRGSHAQQECAAIDASRDLGGIPKWAYRSATHGHIWISKKWLLNFAPTSFSKIAELVARLHV